MVCKFTDKKPRNKNEIISADSWKLLPIFMCIINNVKR
jgi:hypothetical protein